MSNNESTIAAVRTYIEAAADAIANGDGAPSAEHVGALAAVMADVHHSTLRTIRGDLFTMVSAIVGTGNYAVAGRVMESVETVISSARPAAAPRVTPTVSDDERSAIAERLNWVIGSAIAAELDNYTGPAAALVVTIGNAVETAVEKAAIAKSARAPRPVTDRNGNTVTVSDLIEAGFLTIGETITATRGDSMWTTELTDGEVGGYKSLSGWATAVRGTSTNGWLCYVTRDGELVQLSTIRDEYRQSVDTDSDTED